MVRKSAVFGLLITIFISCIGSLLPMPALASKETIVFWYGATQDERAVYERMVSDFERDNPDIRVNAMLVPMSYIERKLMLSIAGGAPPDVVRFYTHLGGEIMARQGLEPLDDLARRDNIGLSDFYPVGIKQNSFNGRLYGMPWLLSPNALLYNVDLFKQAGLSRPPRKWDELVRYSLRLTKRDKNGVIQQLGFADIQNFNLYLWQNGGELLSKDLRSPAFNSPEGRSALKWMNSFLHREVGDLATLQMFQSSYKGATQDAFGMGKVAMRIDNPFRIPDLRKYYPNLRFKVAPAPYSRVRTAEVVGNSLVIPRGSRHKEAAWRFIKFVTSKEQMVKVCRAASRIPARRSAATSPKFYSDPILRPFVNEIPYGRSIPVVPGYQEFSEALGRNLEPALKQEATADRALANADMECGKILSRAMEDLSKFSPVDWRKMGTAAAGLLFALIAVGVFFVLFRTRGSRAARREAITFYMFVAPWLIGFIVLTFGASLASLVFSFCRWDILTPARFIGGRNYVELLSQDPRFLKSLGNTVYYAAFAVPLGIIAGLAVAMLMNQKLRGIAIFRTVYYLPVIVSGVATVIVWRWLFDPTLGLVNRLLTTPVPWISLNNGLHFTLQPLIVNPPKWLLDPAFAKPVFILMSLWGVGSAMVIFLAALQGVPEELREAAKLDGANSWQSFRHVTLPLLTPAIFYQLIIGTVASFQIFTQAYLLTNGSGGPADSTLFYVLYLYKNAFEFMKMGYASSMAWVLFLVVMLITLIQFKAAGKWVYYEAESERN
ncbi:MAG: extracellular solute-binding protein [Armatimonadota bacterium]|nr:extracellular solute-binding protein [Armatimonadota bacterium]